MDTLKKAYADCNQCIVMAANEDFAPCMSVMLQSIYDYAKKDNKYDIIVLHKDITFETQNILIGMIGEKADYISLRFLDVSHHIRNKRFYTGNKTHFTAESYYRLMIPWILDEEYKLALYVDGDMLMKRDLYELFLEDIGDNMIGAVKDYWGICNCYIPGDSRREYRESLGLTDIDHYIIARTLMMNLSTFRDHLTMKGVLEMAVSRQWKQHDQDIINVLCKDRIHFYNPEWGYLTDYGNNRYLPLYMQDELEGVEEHPAIIHFAGNRKPWIFAYHMFGADFWVCAEKTPYFEQLLLQIPQPDYRFYVASTLNGKTLPLVETSEGMQYVYKGIPLGGLNKGHARYRIIKVHNNVLHLEGLVGAVGDFYDCDLTVFVEINGKLYQANSQTREDGIRENINYMTYRGEAFIFDIPLERVHKKYKVKLLCKIGDTYYDRIDLGFDKYCTLTRKYKHSYCVSENRIIRTDRNYLYIYSKNPCRQFIREGLFLYDLCRKKRYKAIAARMMAAFAKIYYRKPIWIVSDRLSRADDNGEAFFRYLNDYHKEDIDSYFVIRKTSPDYERLQSIGKVLDSDSKKFRVLQLISEYSVSSQTDRIYRTAFKIRESYCDLTGNIKFVFLQHGVIVSDLSRWLKRKNQQLTGFVTSTEKEYQRVLNGDYGYQDEVWLTGMPRFDYLQDRREKIITIMPTWRKYLAIKQDHHTGVWDLNRDFADSSYASFYRGLMHDERLRNKAKELGYQIQFKVHPSFWGKEDAFLFDRDVCIVPPETSYRDIYESSALLVSDYSSSIFDFLYLEKPIIYCQFDYDEFFSGEHIYDKGDFDYEKEGFGEVEYTLDQTVERIIEYMENDCALKDVYRDRIQKAFCYHDKNNCQRIYEKMIAARD